MESDAPVRISMRPPHPGRFVREDVLDPVGLSETDAARALRVRRATLSQLLNGRTALSPEMVLRLEKAFAVPMDTLRRLQALHDAHALRERTAEIAVPRYRSGAEGKGS